MRYLAAFLLFITSAFAQQRAIVIAFGPGPESGLRRAAGEASPAVLEWAKSPGTTIDLRRTGLRDGQELVKFMQPAAIEAALADAARLATASPDRFLDHLEISISAAARRPGERRLLLILEVPVPTEDVRARLRQISDTAKSRQVPVLLWTLNPAGAVDPAWLALAQESRGAASTSLAQLAASLPTPAATAPQAAVQAAPAEPTAEAAKPVVHTALFRTEGARRAGPALGVMMGLFVTQVPMRSLQFSPQGSTATARVRVTQVVKDKSGQHAWRSEKEITIKSPVSRLEARNAGSLSYVRELKLPGGQYTLESTVEDLAREAKTVSTAAIVATDSLPGLAASGILFVRKLDRQSDQLEGDSVLQYEGSALIPILDPLFPANTPFDLPVYFLFYPDINGKRPQLHLDVLQNGQPIGGTDLAFTDNLRDDSRSGGGGIAGEQKGEFPYLAKLAGALLLAGSYEVRITIRQDTQTVTRSAPFRVAEGAPGR